MNNYIGKSDGTTLTNHTLLVCKYANDMCDIAGINDNKRKNVLISALLHDIGKAVSNYQNYFNHTATSTAGIPRHHLIGWAVLKKYCKQIDENILHSIYWHHSETEKSFMVKAYNSDTDILKDIPKTDIDAVLEYAKYILKIEQFEIDFNLEGNDEKIPPNFYINAVDVNQLSIFNRSLLVTADRLASSSTPDEVSELLINNNKRKDLLKALMEKPLWRMNKPDTYEDNRYYEQLKTIDDIINNKTTVYKAPAGYGKTLIGLLWAAKSNKKLLWIVPRNIVAVNIYDSILKEMKAFGLNISIELYTAKERKLCTDMTVPDFQSDIVVTNIDNFMYATTDNSFGHRSFSVFSHDIVFDEYHELVTYDALFYGFINTMKIRHKISDCRTLLLSATPTNVHELWDPLSSRIPNTVVYPNLKQHLPAQHNDKFGVSFFEGDIDEVVNKINLTYKENDLVICNSIVNSQKIYHDTSASILLHSKFEDEDYENKRGLIISRYSKNPQILNNFKTCSTRILESSLDVSFQNLFKITHSPESDIQACGRCNRHGGFLDPKIMFIRLKDKSNDTAIKLNYNKELSDNWFEHLKKSLEDRPQVTINELYVIYNEFNKLNNASIQKSFINPCLNDSLNRICKIYPTISEKDEKALTGGSGSGEMKYKETLRGNDRNTANYICTYLNDDKKYMNITNEKYYLYETIEEHFDSDDDTMRVAKKQMKLLNDKHGCKYPRNFLNGNVRLDKMAKCSNRKETPFIVNNWNYSPDFGVLKNKTIRSFSISPLKLVDKENIKIIQIS